MVKRPAWLPKLDPAPPPRAGEPGYVFWKYANERAHTDAPGWRIWLWPYFSAEPSLERWVLAYAAIDKQRDPAPLVSLLKSSDPLKHYASQYLANLLERHDLKDARGAVIDLSDVAALLLKADAELPRNARLQLADQLDQNLLKKKHGPPKIPAYEQSEVDVELNFALEEAIELAEAIETVEQALLQISKSNNETVDKFLRGLRVSKLPGQTYQKALRQNSIADALLEHCIASSRKVVAKALGRIAVSFEQPVVTKALLAQINNLAEKPVEAALEQVAKQRSGGATELMPLAGHHSGTRGASRRSAARLPPLKQRKLCP